MRGRVYFWRFWKSEIWGALINLSFRESEIWGAFIFIAFHTMEGGAFINMKFRANLPLKHTVKPAAGRDNEKGVRLFLEIFTQWRGALIYLRFENLKFGVRLFLNICTQ